MWVFAKYVFLILLSMCPGNEGYNTLRNGGKEGAWIWAGPGEPTTPAPVQASPLQRPAARHN